MVTQKLLWWCNFNIVMLPSVTDIYIFAVGSDIFDNNLMHLTTVRPNEKHYFRLDKISKQLEQTFDDIIGK